MLWVQRCNDPLPANIRLILQECMVSSHWPWPASLGSQARMFRKCGGKTTFCIRGRDPLFGELHFPLLVCVLVVPDATGEGEATPTEKRRVRFWEEAIHVHTFRFQPLGCRISFLGRRDRVPQTGTGAPKTAEVPFPTVPGAQSLRSRCQQAGSAGAVTQSLSQAPPLPSPRRSPPSPCVFTASLRPGSPVTWGHQSSDRFV